MDRGLAIPAVALAGGLIAIQPVINAGLARETGGLAAGLISFLIGTMVLLVIVGLSGQLGNVQGAGNVSWYYLLGGLLGAIYVCTALFAVRSIGAGAVAAATITGQLAMAVIADRLGILGLTQIPITPARVAGVVLLLVGTYLIVR